MSIDEIDLRILDMLQRNGKLSQARIAGAVGLTTPSVNERIKKMERHGMIRGFVALLDHEKMGLPLTAYVDVCLEHPRFEKGFVDDLEKLLAVQECHYLAGEFAYRLKVKAADPSSLADFLQRRILGDQGRDSNPGPDLAVLEEGIDAAAADPREADEEPRSRSSRAFRPPPATSCLLIPAQNLPTSPASALKNCRVGCAAMLWYVRRRTRPQVLRDPKLPVERRG